jgi:hypothetical protein
VDDERADSVQPEATPVDLTNEQGAAHRRLVVSGGSGIGDNSSSSNTTNEGSRVRRPEKRGDVAEKSALSTSPTVANTHTDSRASDEPVWRSTFSNTPSQSAGTDARRASTHTTAPSVDARREGAHTTAHPDARRHDKRKITSLDGHAQSERPAGGSLKSGDAVADKYGTTGYFEDGRAAGGYVLGALLFSTSLH